MKLKHQIRLNYGQQWKTASSASVFASRGCCMIAVCSSSSSNIRCALVDIDVSMWVTAEWQNWHRILVLCYCCGRQHKLTWHVHMLHVIPDWQPSLPPHLIERPKGGWSCSRPAHAGPLWCDQVMTGANRAALATRWLVVARSSLQQLAFIWPCITAHAAQTSHTFVLARFPTVNFPIFTWSVTCVRAPATVSSFLSLITINGPLWLY